MFFFPPKDAIDCQQSLVRFITLCLTLLPVTGSVTHALCPQIAFFASSISEISLDSKMLVLKLVVSLQSHRNIEVNVISTSSRLCAHVFPEYCCLFVHYVMFFFPTLCMYRMYFALYYVCVPPF